MWAVCGVSAAILSSVALIAYVVVSVKNGEKPGPDSHWLGVVWAWMSLKSALTTYFAFRRDGMAWLEGSSQEAIGMFGDRVGGGEEESIGAGPILRRDAVNGEDEDLLLGPSFEDSAIDLPDHALGARGV